MSENPTLIDFDADDIPEVADAEPEDAGDDDD